MSEFIKAFDKLEALSKVDIEPMNLQEISDHRFEATRLHDLCIKLLDEIEARQSIKKL